MSMQAMGKVPPYQDISHFRAPYKNAIFAGLGAVSAAAPRASAGPMLLTYWVSPYGSAWYTTSADPTERPVVSISRQPVSTTVDAIARKLARHTGVDVAVHRLSADRATIGPLEYLARAHAQVQLHGFGDDPAACVAPKWQYNETTGQCHCAPGYAATPDGNDCIPLTPNPVPPTGGLDTWTLTDPLTGTTVSVPAGTPGAVPSPAPATPAPAACTGYQVGSTCVPTWALWVGGGLAALLVVDMVL